GPQARGRQGGSAGGDQPSTAAAAQCRMAHGGNRECPLHGMTASGWGGGSSSRCSAVRLPGPVMARAQQSAVPVIGYLSTRGPDTDAPFVSAFDKGLNEA